MKLFIFCLVASLGMAGCTSTEVASSLVKQQGYYKVGKPYDVEGRTYYPAEVADYSEEGQASWYGPGFYGKRTANGDIMGREDVTAAHRTLPMPSVVKVTNLENNKTTVVKINDRGPFRKDRIIDVSAAAAKQLGFHGNGTSRVRVEFMPTESRIMAEAAKRGDNMTLADIMNMSPGTATAPPMVIAETITQQAAAVPAGQIDTEDLGNNTIVVTTPAAPPPAQVQMANYPVPAAPTASAPATTTIVTTTTAPAPRAGLYVQAGAFAKPENAQAAAAKLQALGPVNVSTINHNGAQLYRVRLAARSNDEAAVLLDKIQQTGLVGAKIISE